MLLVKTKEDDLKKEVAKPTNTVKENKKYGSEIFDQGPFLYIRCCGKRFGAGNNTRDWMLFWKVMEETEPEDENNDVISRLLKTSSKRQIYRKAIVLERL